MLVVSDSISDGFRKQPHTIRGEALCAGWKLTYVQHLLLRRVDRILDST